MEFFWDRLRVGPGELVFAVRVSGALAATGCAGPGLGESAACERLAARLPAGALLRRDVHGVAAGARAALSAYLADGGADVAWPAEAAAGTPYQRKVWEACRGIQKGRTVTYGELARVAGGGARAVGAALGANPLCVVWPCHRVVGAGGVLTGYAGGLEWKRWLLRQEKVALDATGCRVLSGSWGASGD